METEPRTTDAASDMARFLRGHGEIAEALHEVLRDEKIPLSTKGPAVAAARYSVEDLDLIPDGVPLYGLMDDLFVVAAALEVLLPGLGEKGAAIGARRLAGGETVAERLKCMKETFFGFWSYCKRASETLVRYYTDFYAANPQDFPDLVTSFAAEVEEIKKKAGQPIKLDGRDMTRFVAQFRAAAADEP